jgi:hypothetical protein
MKVLVHSFNLGDVDDPHVYAAEPIWKWQQTDAGKWVIKHSNPAPDWTVGFTYQTYGYKVNIIANLEDRDVTYFNLKWGNK